MKFAWFFIAAAVVAGCSGGSGGDTSSAPATTPTGGVTTSSVPGKPAPSSRPPMPTDNSATTTTTGSAGATTGYPAVQAIFTTSCVKCHSGPKPKYKMDLTSYDMVMKGGAEGPVVIAGNVATSRLDKALHGKGAKQMPPMGPLSDGDIKTIEDWIKAGAKNS